MATWLFIVIALISSPFMAHATPLVFASGVKATDTIQLYTSEGCSSCPRADRWLMSLKARDGLFKTFIPMAFHVDYWNWIGWKDPYSKRIYSERQRQMVREGILSQTYTPAFVVNNQEFRQWFKGGRTWKMDQREPGVLTVVKDKGYLDVSFPAQEEFDLHVAWLGMGLKNAVNRGENKGRVLKHDFVVLSHYLKMGVTPWRMKLPEPPEVGQNGLALVVWLSPVNSSEIVQAAATLLP